MVDFGVYRSFLVLCISCWGIWSVQSFAILGPALVSLRLQSASQFAPVHSVTVNPTRPTLLYATHNSDDTSDSPPSQAEQSSEEHASSSSNPSAEEATSQNVTQSAASDNTPTTVDISQTPAFLLKKLEGLQKKLNETEGEIKEAEELLKQGKEEWAPELEKMRSERQRLDSMFDSEAIKQEALVDVIRASLELIDNFDRSFIGCIPKSEEDEKIIEEYRSVYTEMWEVFAKHGVQQVETVGKEFDVECHEAIAQEDSDQYEAGIVCEEFRKGFKVGDKLIREALVVVAA